MEHRVHRVGQHIAESDPARRDVQDGGICLLPLLGTALPRQRHQLLHRIHVRRRRRGDCLPRGHRGVLQHRSERHLRIRRRNRAGGGGLLHLRILPQHAGVHRRGGEHHIHRIPMHAQRGVLVVHSGRGGALQGGGQQRGVRHVRRGAGDGQSLCRRRGQLAGGGWHRHGIREHLRGTDFQRHGRGPLGSLRGAQRRGGHTAGAAGGLRGGHGRHSRL